jgi:nucleoside-diphosphate-sugar epimerase
MKIAVTGGAGFLGYHLCRELADKFDEILVMDIAPIDRKEYPPHCQYKRVDVRDKQKLIEYFNGIDFVIHGAAALPLWSKKDIFDTNINGTRNVLSVAESKGVRRVVFVSSTAVYGVPEKHPIYEDDALIGVGAYGESKIFAEEICREFGANGLCVPIVRPKTFIGTGRLGVFQILYDWVKSGKKIPIIGNGENHYQLLEVKDLVNSIYLMLTLPQDRVNETFNVGATEFGTVKEDVGALCDYSGTGARVFPVPSWIAKPILSLLWISKLSPLYKWVYDTADTDSFVSTQKAQEVLGWEPEFSNKDALIRSYRWYLKHYKELQDSGITHRVAWKQGMLSLVKKFM